MVEHRNSVRIAHNNGAQWTIRGVSRKHTKHRLHTGELGIHKLPTSVILTLKRCHKGLGLNHVIDTRNLGVKSDAGEDRAHIKANVETVGVEVGPIAKRFRRGGVRAIRIGNKSVDVIGNL